MELYKQARALKELYDVHLKQLRAQVLKLPAKARTAATAVRQFSLPMADLVKPLNALAGAAEAFEREVEDLAGLAGDTNVSRPGNHPNNIELMIAAIIQREFERPPWQFIQDVIHSVTGIHRNPGTLARAVSRARVNSDWFRSQLAEVLDDEDAIAIAPRKRRRRRRNAR